MNVVTCAAQAPGAADRRESRIENAAIIVRALDYQVSSFNPTVRKVVERFFILRGSKSNLRASGFRFQIKARAGGLIAGGAVRAFEAPIPQYAVLSIGAAPAQLAELAPSPAAANS